MEKTTWVDFKKVKESLLIQKVVEHYSWELKPSKGNELPAIVLAQLSDFVYLSIRFGSSYGDRCGYSRWRS